MYYIYYIVVRFRARRKARYRTNRHGRQQYNHVVLFDITRGTTTETERDRKRVVRAGDNGDNGDDDDGDGAARSVWLVRRAL